MLLLLPPSEGKATGGRGPQLDLDGLSFPSLRSTRGRLVEAVQQLAQLDPEALRRALGLSAATTVEIAANAALTTAPTMPALALYRGVLFEALDYGSLRGGALRRANGSLLVASALWGLVRPQDRLPPYRLSAGTVLPGPRGGAGIGGLGPLWRPELTELLGRSDELLVDLRSGAYRALGQVERAVEVRVLRDTAGVRTVVSHDNKFTKGRLARVLCESGARSVREVAEAGRSVADAVEVDGRRVDLVLRGLATARAQVRGTPARAAPQARSGYSE